MGIRAWNPATWDEEEAKISAMSLDQVHKKIDRTQQSLEKLATERKRRKDRLEELRKIGQRHGTWTGLSEKFWDSQIREVDKKMWKKQNELDKWDKIREEKVEEEVEVEETQEQSEQEQEELEEAIAPTNYHIPWKEAGLNYENIKTKGWGTKEQRVKRMSVEQVEMNIQGCQEVINMILESKIAASKSKRPLSWFNNNKFWAKEWRKKTREKAEWEQIKAIKLGAKEESINDYDEEEEQEKLNEILGQSYSDRWGDRPSDTGDTGNASPLENTSLLNEEEELDKTFGDEDPESAYENTRQKVSEADKLLWIINWTLERTKKETGEGDADALLEKVWSKKRSKRFYNKNIYKIKSILEKEIRKGVKKLEKQRELIAKKDEYDSWGLLRQYTSHKVSNVGTGSFDSRSSGLQFTIKKFR